MTELLHLCKRHLYVAPLAQALRRSLYSTLQHHNSEQQRPSKERADRWHSLPPFAPGPDAASSASRGTAGRAPPGGRAEPTTALKWVRRCCPHLPMSLVQKLFRLRQVRKETVNSESSGPEIQAEQKKPKRVSAKDTLISGDVVLLPITAQKLHTEVKHCYENDEEINFIRSLVLYKDPAIIVVNKPQGMAVQGGVGIKYSMDALGAVSLKFDYSEPPRLVHRLDRDSSGILVLGRTQASASVLHSVFREKTSTARSDDIETIHRVLQRKYWALVIGVPRNSRGLISAPLAKVTTEDGTSERVTIARDAESPSSQHAMTEYKVIRSAHGYTWLELRPLTGRKHQLRVHCAEALGTPIVGDYKYGWRAHRKLEPMTFLKPKTEKEKLPFGLESEGGSISEKQPRLHLHCRQMILPNISVALQHLESSSLDHDLSKLETLDLVAPIPSHIRTSWEILSY